MTQSSTPQGAVCKHCQAIALSPFHNWPAEETHKFEPVAEPASTGEPPRKRTITINPAELLGHAPPRAARPSEPFAPVFNPVAGEGTRCKFICADGSVCGVIEDFHKFGLGMHKFVEASPFIPAEGTPKLEEILAEIFALAGEYIPAHLQRGIEGILLRSFIPASTGEANGQLKKVYDYFMGPHASGSFTCSCNKPDVCGICELRLETEAILAPSSVPQAVPPAYSRFIADYAIHHIAASRRKRMIRKHVVNGDQQNGWYCYECDFTTRDVAAAAEHDGLIVPEPCTPTPVVAAQAEPKGEKR